MRSNQQVLRSPKKGVAAWLSPWIQLDLAMHSSVNDLGAAL